MAQNTVVTLYTDGACSVKSGRGGWGCLLDYKGVRKTLSGGLNNTTNNRMELLAVIKGLEHLKFGCNVTVVTDSKYVADGYSKGWVFKWMGKPNFDHKKNEDLWRRLVKLGETHKLTFRWVKGHKGHPENEVCDALAVAAYQPSLVLKEDIR